MQENIEHSHKVAQLCQIHYSTILKKTGKPQNGSEWTLLAAIVMKRDEDLKVVSMATGSKCLGRNQISQQGDLIHDSHAEVLARRGFVRFIYSEMHKVLAQKESPVLENLPSDDHLRFRIKKDVSFHFYSSHTPCGDASIFPKLDIDMCRTGDNQLYERKTKNKNTEEVPCKKIRMDSGRDNLLNSGSEHEIEHTGSKNEKELNSSMPGVFSKSPSHIVSKQFCDESISTKETQNGSCCEPPSRKEGQEEPIEQDEDIYRTGAKCVPGGIQDALTSGTDYHTPGALRTKPGRGDRTLSMSCSDKMALWNIVGIQGALLAQFLQEPIYFKSIIIGRCPYNSEALRRAVISRCNSIKGLPKNYHLNVPQLFNVDVIFPHSKAEISKVCQSKVVPCSAAIIWFYNGTNEGFHQAIVNGRKLGVTAKALKMGKVNSRCSVCSKDFFIEYQKILSHQKAQFKELNYMECKQLSRDYQTAKECFLQVFSTWVRTPDSYKIFK